MMRRVAIVVTIFLALYSVAIAVTEWRTSQDHIRSYLGDITADQEFVPADVDFYLVNTTLSVFLLWTAALIFLIAAHCADPTVENLRTRQFMWSQVAVFAYLGIDDRFQLHEKIAFRIGDIPDDTVIGVIGLIELTLLATLGRRLIMFADTRRWLVAAGAATIIMFVTDAYVSEDLRLRLSIEDLAKSWGGWFLVLFAWTFLDRELVRLRRNE